MGARFAFETGMRSQQRPTPRQSLRDRLSHAATILIVEDEPSIRGALSELFEGAGDVVAAATLDEALDALRSSSFDLIVTDLRLGAARDGGFQVMALAGLLSPDAPIVVLTAFPDIEARRASDRLRATHFLTKPVDLGEIAGIAERAGIRTSLAGSFVRSSAVWT